MKSFVLLHACSPSFADRIALNTRESTTARGFSNATITNPCDYIFYAREHSPLRLEANMCIIRGDAECCAHIIIANAAH